MQKTNTKSFRKSRSKFRVFELKIPKQYYPKRRGNKSKEFAQKTEDVIKKLHDIELDLEFHLMNIKNSKKILFSKKRVDRPMNLRYLYNLNKEIEELDHEYENYCLRVYIYRETIWKFMANFLDIKERYFSGFLEDSKTRKMGLDRILAPFGDNGDLKDIILYRNRITHKFEEKNLQEKKMEELFKKLDNDTKRVNRSLNKIIKIHKNVAEKIIAYKREN